MSERKNIERLFQEKFKDFEVAPAPQVWQGIASKLEKKENKKRVIPFWLKASGIAASLVLGYLAVEQYTGWNSNVNSDNNSETIVSSESSNKESNDAVSEQNSTTKETNAIDQNTSIVANEEDQNHQNTTSKINSTTSKINQSTLKTSNTSLVSSEKNNGTKSNSFGKANQPKAIKNHQFQSNASNEIAHNTPKNHSKRNSSNASSVKEDEVFSVNDEKQSVVQNNASTNSPSSKKEVINKDGQNNNVVVIDKSLNNLVENQSVAQNNTATNLQSNKKDGITKDNQKNDVVVTDKSSNNLVENKNSDNNISFKEQLQNNAMAESNRQKANADQLILTNDAQNNWIAYAVNPNLIVDNTKAKDSTAVAVVEENPLEKLLREKQSKEKEEKIIVENSSKWKVRPNVAPLFMNASQGSPIDDQFADNAKDFENNLSIGLGLDYALSPKFAIRTGINRFNVGYNTNDIAYYVDLNSKDNSTPQAIQTINMKPQYSIVVEDRNNNTSGNQEIAAQNKDEGFLNQRFGYIEVPFEVSYKLVDKKFGVQIITGLSTLFLNENKVSVVSNGFSTVLGEANNLNKIHYSTNIGVGFKYNFWKSFEANFEPTLKYQINTFNANSGGFKPYLIGLYTGISYKF